MTPSERKEKLENSTAVFAFAAVAVFLSLFLSLWVYGARHSAAAGITVVETAREARININTASAEELTALSGIGETKAKAIVAYRERHGAFSTVEDIIKVYGIGPATFEKIKDYITV